MSRVFVLSSVEMNLPVDLIQLLPTDTLNPIDLMFLSLNKLT